MTYNNINSQDYTYGLIKRGLEVATLRGQVIANNIANVNTKNYKRSDVSFEDTLNDKSEKIKEQGYIDKSSTNFGEIKVIKDNTTIMNSDGNNVDFDMEKANQASNTLMYNALITQASSHFKMMETVIGGR